MATLIYALQNFTGTDSASYVKGNTYTVADSVAYVAYQRGQAQPASLQEDVNLSTLNQLQYDAGATGVAGTDDAGNLIGADGYAASAIPLVSTIKRAFTSVDNATIPQPGFGAQTWQAVFGCERKFTKFRIGYLSNNLTTDYTVAKTVLWTSDTYTNGNPTNGVMYSVTFGGGAAATVTSSGVLTTPNIVWSDWITGIGVDRSDVANGAFLAYVRSFIDSTSGNYNYSPIPANTTGYSKNNANGVPIRVDGWSAGDKTASGWPASPTSPNNGLSIAIEFECAQNSINVGWVGDSTMAGKTVISSAPTVLDACFGVGPAKAIYQINAMNFPYFMSFTNYALGASQFDAYMDDIPALLDDNKFDIFFLQPHTPNTPPITDSVWNAQLTKTLAMIKLVREAGAVPIIMGSTPHNASSATANIYRRRTDAFFRNNAAKLNIDFCDFSFLGNGAATESYLPQYSDDGLHPNNTAEIARANVILPILLKAVRKIR